MTSQAQIRTWDDIDAELYECRVLTRFVWDMVTDLGYDGPKDRETMDRLNVLASITADKVERLEAAIDQCGLRPRGEKAA